MWVLRLFITMCDKTLGTLSSILYPVVCQLSPITLSKSFVMSKSVGKLRLSQLCWLHLYDLNNTKWQNPNYLNPDSKCISTTHTAHSFFFFFPSCCDVFVKYCADSWKPDREREREGVFEQQAHSGCVIVSPTQWGIPLHDWHISPLPIHPSIHPSSFPPLALSLSQAQLLLNTPH